MSELTKEQLLEYVKKQKLKMKKMETEIATLKEKAESAPIQSTNSHDELTTLRSDIKTLEKQLSCRDEEIISLSKAVENAEDEKNQLVSQKNAELAALVQMNESLRVNGANQDNLLAEIGRLESLVNVQQEKIEAFTVSTEEIQELKTQLAGALAREAAAQADVTSLNTSIDQIKVSATQLDEGNKSYITQIGELEGLIKDLQDKLHQFEIGEQALHAELQMREASTNSVTEQLAASLEIIVGLKGSIETLTAAQEEASSSASGAQEELRSVTSELRITKEELTVTQNELLKIKGELQVKIEDLAEAVTRNRDLEAEIERVSNAPVAVPEPQASATATTAPSPPQLESSSTNGSKKKGKNNKKGKGKAGDSTETEPAEAPIEVVTSTEETSRGTLDETASATRMQQLEVDLAAALSHRAILEQTHATQLAALEEKIAQIFAAEQTAKEDSSALTARLQSLSAEWTASQARSEAAAVRNAELDAEIVRLEKELTEVSEQLRAASSGAETYAQTLRDEVNTLKLQLEELRSELSASSTRETESRESIVELTAKLIASSDAESFAQILQSDIDALTKQRDEHQSSLESATLREDVIRAELQQTKADLSAQLEAYDSLRDKSSALELKCKAIEADYIELERSLSQRDAHLSSLEAELDTLKNANNSSQFDNAQEITSLKQLITQLEAQIIDYKTTDTAKTEEIRTLKETSTLSEANNKKLLVKLKSKMKECTDLNAELSSAKESVNKSAGAEAVSATLADRIAELELTIKTKTGEKAELDSRLKATNDTLIAGEERISSLLREKNKLQEDLFESLHKIESATKEAHTFKTERDLARQQYLDAETKLQALSTSTRDKIDSLTAKVTEITAYNNTQAAQITSLNETLALSNAEITTLKENAAGLSQTSAKLKSSSATVESLKQQLQEAKTSADAKAEAGAEKIKKLKQLLAKVNAALQEKDSRLTQLLSANDRAKKFNIVSRIGIVPPQDPSGEELQWCLIYEHRAKTPSSDDDSAPQYRWIEARVAHKWMAEGSTLVGAWPQPVQETWAAELSSLRTRLETERDELSVKYEEVSAQFQAYKVRAQTALKRIGNEDRNERQKVQEAENAEIEKLRGVVQDFREKVSDFNTIIAEKDRTIAQYKDEIFQLHTESELLQNTISDNAQAQHGNERRIASLQKEIETLQEDYKTMQEQYEAADRNNRERRVQQLRAEEEAALRAATKSSEASTPVLRAASPVPSSSEVQDSSMLDTSESSSQLPPLSPIVTNVHNPPSRGLSRETSLSTHNSVYSPRGRSSAVEVALAADVNDASDNKLLLFQQADHMLRDSVAILRQENSQLMVEINELKNDFGLREDQVQVLKDTVRELESSLCREKEFNAENRRINADYLVNILRNFLMSTEPSERAKLVPVLCQILHLGAEESRVIAEKWAVRTGGLVGWLLPPRPPAPPATPRYQQHATGMSIDRGDGAPKASGADLTYDHSTGAGIDVNGY